MMFVKSINKPIIHLSLNEIMIYFAAFFCLRLNSIGYIVPASSLYYYASFVILAFAIILFVLSKSRKSSIIYLTMLLFGLFVFATLYHNPQNLYSAIVEITPPLSIALLAELNMQKRPIQFLKAINALFITLMFIDLFTLFVFPKGLYASELYKDNWFLGYKSERVRAVTLPAIAVAGILDVEEFKKPYRRFLVVSLLAMLVSYLSGATAGTLVCLFEFLAICILFFSNKERTRRFMRRLFDARVAFLLILGLNLFFVVFQAFQSSKLFEYVIVNLLGKSMTISGRTRIWAASLQQFMESRFIGNGHISGTRYTILTGIRGGTQPHNLMLALLVYTGLIGLAIYGVMLVLTLRKAEVQKLSLTIICSVCILTNMLFGITTMNMFGQFHYAMMVILYYIAIYEKKKL